MGRSLAESSRCVRKQAEAGSFHAAQLTLAYLFREASFWLIVPMAFAFGGIFSQWLLLANHELSHNLAFKKPLHNRLFGLFTNLPIGVPVVEGHQLECPSARNPSLGNPGRRTEST